MGIETLVGLGVVGILGVVALAVLFSMLGIFIMLTLGEKYITRPQVNSGIGLLFLMALVMVFLV
jgi:hypothetical protein